MSQIIEHPLRYECVNELHARPFPQIAAPAQVTFLALKPAVNAANRDRAADLAHLGALLMRAGAQPPSSGVIHHAAQIGQHQLKWESHTEFTSFLAHRPSLSARAFDPAEGDVFPADWIGAAQGQRLAALQVRIEVIPDDPAQIDAMLADWFVAESLACAEVLDGAAVIAGDFRIDPAGQMRFVIFVHPETGPGRTGRIVQRLCEVETYRAMSMLGLGRARTLGQRLNALEPRLSDLVAGLTEASAPEETLHDLLRISAELEALAVQHSFRFGATAAYEAIVTQRIQVLREARFQGRQMFSEFMLRRYDPAMRTVKSTEKRLGEMLTRALRAGELLRTQVDVARSKQNQKLLESMDRRADLQLRLQHTVEGLSVVAISYYAVSLAGYLAYPVAKSLSISKEMMTAGLTPVVILAVFLMVRSIRKGFGAH
ncbi:DUF3422 family protein [Albirhodobacter sp. R86504]|uniref:DUF3422 family protein n=1 Tax=Albirhodobacter sp. R86504 TaxID=3093848 RepID=UPI0036704E66